MSGKIGKKRDRRGEGRRGGEWRGRGEERIGEDIMREEKGLFGRRWAGEERQVAGRVNHRRSVGLLKRVDEDITR